MFEEITGTFDVGVTHDGEIIIFVDGVWEAAITPDGARQIAANLYVAAAEAQNILAARNN